MTKVAAPPAGLRSVIVRRLGGIESARRCLEALVEKTRSPWELIVLDDGSDDETSAHVAELGRHSSVRVELISSLGNGSFRKILGVASGEYLAFVEGDAVVTDAWLDQLVALARSDPGIGLAGSMTNDGPPPQCVADPDYVDRDGMHSFARRYRDAQRGRWLMAGRVSGPARLIKRGLCEILAAADGLERLDPFGDDLSAEIERAGFGQAVAFDLFIHRGPWPTISSFSAPARPPTTRIVSLSRAEFAGRYGDPDTSRALCAYTPPGDTRAVLALLEHARPLLVLEIGTAFGHMTANLAEWSRAEARIVSVGTVRGMDPGGPSEQSGEAPERADLGRLAGYFGQRDKIETGVPDPFLT